MKICIDCKHYKSPNFCFSPNNGRDLVTGGNTPIWSTTSRKTIGMCEIAARYFEPKEMVKSKPWWRFW